jgi:hypothetical protein
MKFEMNLFDCSHTVHIEMTQDTQTEFSNKTHIDGSCTLPSWCSEMIYPVGSLGYIDIDGGVSV